MKLTIGNSTCSLSEVSRQQFNDIRLELSYCETVRNRFAGYQSVRRFLMDRKGEFPTGLLYLVEDYIRTNKINVVRNDKRIRPKTHQNGPGSLFLPGCKLTPYPEQLEAAKAIFNAHDGRGIIVAPTGLGKTLITALICDQLRVPTLIVVPNLELKKQTISELRKWFGSDKVGESKKGVKQYFITVENYDALSPKKLAVGFDAVIVDEFHHSASKTIRTLSTVAWRDIYFRIGLTATAFRSRPEERLLLESVLSKTIYEVPYHAAVDKGYIVPMEAYYIELPKIPCKGNRFATVYNELVVERRDRNEIIAAFAKNIEEAGGYSVILTKQVDHGKLLSEMIGDAGFVTGENDTNRELILEFGLCERKTLVGTTGCLGEGVDSRPAEWVIMATTVKSKNLFMQIVGRGFRRFTYPDGRMKDSCKVLMFYDPSHKYMVEHFKACKKYLKDEYGVVPVKLNV